MNDTMKIKFTKSVERIYKSGLQIPVYMNVTSRPSDNAREDEERLVRFFPDEWESIPTKCRSSILLSIPITPFRLRGIQIDSSFS
jgi:hypothetical protein